MKAQAAGPAVNGESLGLHGLFVLYCTVLVLYLQVRSFSAV